MKNLFFFHGMESSPRGKKALLLKKHFPGCSIPQLPPELLKRNWLIEELVQQPSWLIGSSLGGLSALFFAMKNPNLVKEMILLAPAVGFYTHDFFTMEDMNRIQTSFIPEGIRTTVLAGEKDDVIPLVAIDEMIKRSPDKKNIEIIKLDDDHSLNQFPDLLIDLVKKMVG